MAVTVTVSLLAGLAFRRRFRGSTALFYATVASLVVPSIIISLGIGVVFQQGGLKPAWYSSAFGAHLTWTLPFGVLIMAFDETGQADSYERKVEICTRAYKLLTEKIGFPPEDIIFDPNIFAVATGIEEHNNYGVDFIEATRTIRERMLILFDKIF